MKAQSPPPSSARRSRKPQAQPSQRKRPPTVSGRKQASVRRAKRIQSANPDATIRKRGNVYFLFHKERRRISWRLAFTIVLVFVLGIGVAVSFATINNANRQITASRNALIAQQATNLNLRAGTAERYTHEEIMHRARELGFGVPDPSQIIYFYAPAYSQVYFRYNPATDSENHFWQGVIAFLRDIISRVSGQ
ncbi:MAG: hypothetical protein FWC92_01690 [Defluviitaleaceae bacterium]|nr:hypothetical protein [Defluviitaleaceae bacterium]